MEELKKRLTALMLEAAEVKGSKPTQVLRFMAEAQDLLELATKHDKEITFDIFSDLQENQTAASCSVVFLLTGFLIAMAGMMAEK